MLIPKRVKRRRQHRGNIKGQAHKGNKVAYGEYGLVAADGARITSRQIEAARIAMTRFIKRGGQVWIDIRARGHRARGNAPRRPQAAHQDQIHGQRAGEPRDGRDARRRRKNYRRR